MKDMIWNAVRSNVPEGMILPWWALTVRAVLYPLDFFYWRMSKTKGYQLKNDTWLIEGVTYSGSALRLLSKATGETYRVTRTVDTLTLERLPPAEQAESDRLMHQEIDQLRKDAERYRWLRDRYAAADFQWGEHNECVLVFEWPEECSVSGSCDATIDAAMLKTPALAQRANSRIALLVVIGLGIANFAYQAFAGHNWAAAIDRTWFQVLACLIVGWAYLRGN